MPTLPAWRTAAARAALPSVTPRPLGPLPGLQAALLNQHFADMYKGRLLVRFDDTNPSKVRTHPSRLGCAVVLRPLVFLQGGRRGRASQHGTSSKDNTWRPTASSP